QSKEDCQTAIENNFIDENKILTIGNGVDIWNKFNSQKIDKKAICRLYEELKLDKDDKVVTFVGRLVAEKGILDLIEAFNMIDDHKVKLLIVGNIAQGERDNSTKEILKKYEKNSSVIFTGHRKDIP